MRGKTKCSKSSLESKRLELRSNDRLCRTLICKRCISESLIPTHHPLRGRVILFELDILLSLNENINVFIGHH